MSSQKSRINYSEPIYFLIFIVTPILIVFLTLAALFANVLWIIIFTIPFVIIMPIWFYIDARVRRKFLGGVAKYALFYIVFTISIILLTFNWMLLTPEPLGFWPLFVYSLWMLFIMGISSVICERFLKPKLETAD